MKPAMLAGLGLVVVGAALVLAHRVGVPQSAAPRPSAEDVFTDPVTHFSVAKPAGWWMTAGQTLRQQTEAEARQLGDTRLAPSEGEPIELLVRFTRYAPGAAPGPNPTIVVTRFDLRRFPPGTRPDDLLRIGIASARPEGAATTVKLGRRPWRKIVAARDLSRPDGAALGTLHEVYVTAGASRGLGIVISATRSQYVEYRSAFDALLGSVRFQ
jgi:hypothetical protein